MLFKYGVQRPMIGKPIFMKALVGLTAVVAVTGVAFGYFWVGKQRGAAKAVMKDISTPAPAPAPVPAKAAMLTISGRFKKDLSKHPVFVLGDRPIPFEGDEEDQKSFLGGGTVEVVSLEGEVVASGGIAENGTFSLEIPPAPKYIVRAKNDVVSVSYAVIAGGLPDMKKIAAASKPEAASEAAPKEGLGQNGHGAAAEH